jgi:hypothetical protein
MLRARLTRRPSPRQGPGPIIDHSELAETLLAVSAAGLSSLPQRLENLNGYLDGLQRIDPDQLHRDEALAFWINCYNAGTLVLAGRAQANAHTTVLRIPGGFSTPVVTIAGESLSLDAIEHGKIRRFKDPRIHGALVCGSTSCPTLRSEPFTGSDLDKQLADQMRAFIVNGGGSLDEATNTLTLSRVFKWYGRDFVSPSRMPTILPVRASRVRDVVAGWFPPDDEEAIRTQRPTVSYASYDWSLGCSIV